MRRFATSATVQAAARTLAAIATALSLQACGGGGGGGGGGDTPPPDIEAVAQREALLARQANHYAVTTSESTGHTHADGLRTTQRQLLVIDTRTKSVAYKMDMAERNWGVSDQLNGMWLTTNRWQRDSDGMGGSDLGPSQLLFVDQGRLMQLDLSGDSLGAPRQISGLNVCGLSWHAVQLDDEGKTGWLEVMAAEPGGDCSGQAPASRRIVSLGAGADDMGRAVDEDLAVISDVKDGTGKLTHVLTLEVIDGVSRMVVRSPDLATILQTVDVPGAPSLIPPHGVFFLGGPSRQGARSVMLIGQALHPVDWPGGAMRIGAPILTLQEAGYPLYDTDADHLYVADGCVIHRIDGAGQARLFTTLSGDPGPISQISLTDGYVVVDQRKKDAPLGEPASPGNGCASGTPLSNAALRAVDKSSAALKLDLPSSVDGGLWLLGNVRDQIYFEERGGTGGSRIHRHDLGNGARAEIARDVGLLGLPVGLRYSRIHQGWNDLIHNVLMWCQFSRPEQGTCQPGDALISHDISSRKVVTMGTMPSLDGRLPARTENSHTFLYLDSDYNSSRWVNNPGLLMMSAHFSSPEGYLDLFVPWMITPGVADSLLEIPGTLAPQ